MKKLFLFVAAVAMSIAASATDIWTGSKHVSWNDGGIDIAANLFNDAVAGQHLKVHFTDASDGIEFKLLEVWNHLPGSREAAWISGNGTFEQYLTAAAVDSLKAHGLQVIGANFNCSKVELLDDGHAVKEGTTVWTGFFWADSWSTLELYKEGYEGVDFSKVEAIRFYSEAASGAYVLNFLKSWDEGGKFADQTNMTDGEGYKELMLTDSLRTVIAEAGHWMIQFNKEGLNAFNVTDIVLVMAAEPVVDYYLVGSMSNWEADSAYLFVANPANEGEYMLQDITLTEGTTLKVIGTTDGGTTKTWYPDGMGNDYTVDAAHAGIVSVYFRPEGGQQGWYEGYFYVTEPTPQGIEQTNANTKAIKSFRNGMLVIEKNGKFYNALGVEVK